MDFFFLAIAIALNSASSNVLRLVFTTTHPFPQQNWVCSDLQNQLCVPVCPCVHKQMQWTMNHSGQACCDTQNINKCQPKYTYSKSELLNVNNKCHTVSDTLIKKLCTFGIRKTNCYCKRPKKCKRGSRAGRNKQRKINVITNFVSLPTPQSTRGVNKTNLICVEPMNIKSTDKTSTCNMKIAVINGQSVREKTARIVDLVTDIDCDIMFITETWLYAEGDEPVIEKLTPPGYLKKSFPRQYGLGGGILVLYKNSMNPKCTVLPCGPSFENCQCIFSINGQSVTFVCIYRAPPSQKNKFTKKQFNSEFHEFLDHFATDEKAPIFVGDFNLHFDNPTDTYVSDMLNILQTRLLTQIVNKPTHKKNHILDWVVTDDVNSIINIDVTDKCISDHFVVHFEVPFRKPCPAKRTITCRKKNIDNNSFERGLQNIVTAINSAASTDKVNLFNSKLKDLLDSHAPLRTRTVTDRPSALWMDQSIKTLKAERRKAERKWRKDKLCVDKDIYKNLNNKIKCAIESARRDLYSKQIEECKTSKALFHVASSLCGKKGDTQSSLPTGFASDELPEVFGNFFNDKISKIRGALDAASLSPPVHVPFTGTQMLTFDVVSREDVRKVIKLSAPKSSCLDPIPTPLLMTHLDSLLDPITDIINESLQSGTVPNAFKHAVILPLLKKPNLSPDELKNFRPVSNLPFLSKILEKVVLAQLKKHLSKHNLLDPCQSAYREFHNTETALLKVHNDLLCSTDGGDTAILALLDLSAAFDTIDHSILMERLSTTFGISGSVIEWFKSYVLGRTQCVIVNDNCSSVFDLCYGVPQGSVLGPVLYTMYTQPMGAIIKKHSMCYHMYADDTQVYKSAPPNDFPKLIHDFETCIKEIKCWMVDNKLKMNEDKTEIIKCNTGRCNLSSDLNHICIENEIIPFSDKAKNLGVYFDSKLSMSHQVNNLCRIMYLELRRIKQMSPFLKQSNLKTLMSAFVFSRLDYCNALLYGLPNDTLCKLQKIQNNAARMILKKKKRDHVTPMLRQLHWLPVEARIKYKVATLCYKCNFQQAPQYLYELIVNHVPSLNLRSRNKALLSVPCRANKKTSERAFVHYAPVVWNSLPLDLRQCSSLDCFKRGLKTYLFKMHLSVDISS